jgi:small basic protein
MEKRVPHAEYAQESLQYPWYWKYQLLWEKSRLAVYTLLLLVVSVGNSLYFKRMTSAMPNYCFFLTQISTVFYIPFFGCMAGRGLSDEVKPKVMSSFAIMGMFDSLSGVLQVLGGSHTSGTAQVMLSQFVIPCTLLTSVVWLGKKFHFVQYLGAAAIVLGIVLAKLHSPSSTGMETADDPVFSMIFLTCAVPMAISSCFKEVAFRDFEGDLNVNVLQFWVAIFQMVSGFFAMPMYSLPVLGTQKVPMTDMRSQLVDGSRCLFFLEDQVVTDCGSYSQKPCDACQDAWMSVACYMFFNLCYNILVMLVIKHGSATLSFLVSTLRMPLSSIAFSSTWIMGKDAVQPTFSDLLGLMVIISGLASYRMGGRMLKRKLEKESAANSPSTWLLSDSPPQSPPLVEFAEGLRRKVSTWRFVPVFITGANPQPVFVYVPDVLPPPRSPDRVRRDLIHRLGAASPLHSPAFRGRSPVSSRSGSPEVSPKASPRYNRISCAEDSHREFANDGQDRAEANFALSGMPTTA